jgi:hypothetical protein
MSPATMNWKRGLLRLWAVAAVLWVGVAFYSNDTVQRVQDVSEKISYTTSDGRLFTFPANQKPDVLKAKVIADLIRVEKIINTRIHVLQKIGKPLNLTPSLRDRFDNPEKQRELAENVAAEVIANYHPRSIWPPLFDFAKLAFIPPLFMLAMGYIGLWVGRGFKRSNADEK